MGLFTTRELISVTQESVKFQALFLDLFFKREITFDTEQVMLDKITGKAPIAVYVSPTVQGKVQRNLGGMTRTLKPGYVKPKHQVRPDMVVDRLPGEDPALLQDPAYRRERIIAQNLQLEEQSIVQVEEQQATEAVLYGRYTMTGEQFEPVEVDFGRRPENNITQSGAAAWSAQDPETFDPTYDLDMYADQSTGAINIAVMDGLAWRTLNSFKLFREKLDTRRGSNSQLETALKDLGGIVSFKGYYGELAIIVSKNQYIDSEGNTVRYMPENIIIMGNTDAGGIRCYGMIYDASALAEGVSAAKRYPRNWITTGDPSCEFTMTQSAPLMVLPDPDKFVVIQIA
jgi:hypothetical protein